jgi:hypothetical protein
MTDFIDNDKDNSNKKFKHLCFLFTGKLNYFGSPHWEKYALTEFNHIYNTVRDENIKITFKFIVYEIDGTDTRPDKTRMLSGFDNIYSDLFTEMKNCIDVYKFKYESDAVIDEVNKFDDIVYWLESTELNNSKLKKLDFEYYCKSVFSFAHNVEFYYVNGSNVTQQLQLEFDDSTITPITFGQHFQVGNAYLNYPDMFSDCTDDTLIFKTRYDAVIKSSKPDHIKLPDTFNKLYNLIYCDETIISNLPQKYLKGDKFTKFYDAPLVFYTRAFSSRTKKLYMHFTPDDLLLVFNTAGIKKYARTYTKWLVNFRKSIFDEHTTLSGSMGVSVHTSLGKFFLDNEFNTIDYTPYNHIEPLDLLGALVRFYEPIGIDGDISDDYKIRWYRGQDKVKQMIIEKFGKHDNT